MNIQRYESKEAMRAENPQIKNFTVVYTIKNSDTGEDILRALRRKNIDGLLFRTGNILWKEAQTFSSPNVFPWQKVK